MLVLALLAAIARAAQPAVRDYSDPSEGPSQFRLAYNGPDGMTVSWNTPNKVDGPIVYYGTDPRYLNLTSGPGTSSTFNSSVNWDNHVEISGLQPFTKYYYRVGGQNTSLSAASSDYYFTTARPAGDHTPFTIAAIADLGIVVGDASSKMIPPTFGALLDNRDEYEFLWHNGDFGYADDWLWEELTFVYKWSNGVEAYNNIMNSYFDELSDVTRNTPYMAGVGNHEADCIEPGVLQIGPVDLSICPDGQRNFTYYRNHFRMPTRGQNSDKSYQNMWYSWDYGMVHFVEINTETDHGEGVTAPDETKNGFGLASGPFGYPNQQLQWLEEDLAAVDRKKTPWIIVGGHRPWYVADSSSLCQTCQDAFEEILYKHNVDLVITGHSHYYERDHPVYKGQIDPNHLDNPRAPWYIVNGAAGNFEGHTTVSKWADYTAFLNQDQYGWSKLVFHNATHLEHQFISSETGNVVDQTVLYKDHGTNTTVSNSTITSNSTAISNYTTVSNSTTGSTNLTALM